MKNCKKCGKEISKMAKVCPECGTKNKNVMFLVGILGFITLAIVIITIAGSKAKEPVKKEFKQDEIATFKDVEYSIRQVIRSSGDEYFSAPACKEYVIVTIRIENKSSEKINYNIHDWKIEDSFGDERGRSIWGSTSTSLNNGELNIGGIKEGTIAFEIPKGDQKFILKYYYSILSKKCSFLFNITEIQQYLPMPNALN